MLWVRCMYLIVQWLLYISTKSCQFCWYVSTTLLWALLLKLSKFVSLSADLLALQGGKALLIWYRMCRKDIFHSIEWGSLSGELVNSHHSLFTIDEVAKLSSSKPCSEEAVTTVTSAMKRTPQSVLHAFYKSLCNTQTRGGATQHAIIAEEIRIESECACSCNQALYLLAM